MRYSLDEARAEATRLAEAFVAAQPYAAAVRLRGAGPFSSAPRSASSRHSVEWLVMFGYVPPPGGVVDGDLLVSVNVETKGVEVLPF